MNNKVVLMVLALAAPLSMMPAGPSRSFAQTEQSQVTLPFSTVGFQSGVIDAVQGSTIRIDGRSYVLKSAVVVVNHEGELLEIERIIPTSLVKFHLKEGHIDKMVVTLPQ